MGGRVWGNGRSLQPGRNQLQQARQSWNDQGDRGRQRFISFARTCPSLVRPQDLERNGTSAVLGIQFGGVFVVIPGDATADTCGWINDNVFDKWKKAGKGNPVSPCRALGAPHHGALRTIADNFISTSRAKLGIATKFAKYVSAENVVASAGWYSKFKHPYKSVMLLLAVNADADRAEHDFVWYDDTEADWKHVEDDERGIYTTITTLGDPPKRTGWSFLITPTGEIRFFIDWEQAETIPPFERSERYPATPHKS